MSDDGTSRRRVLRTVPAAALGAMGIASTGQVAASDDGGHSGSSTARKVDLPVTNETEKIVSGPDESDPADEFGRAVAVDGDTAIVGAKDDEAAGNASGSAYVFEYSGGTWRQQVKLVPDDLGGNDWFGASVALSGDVALVGARIDSDVETGGGAVYAFERSGDTWRRVDKLVGDENALGFGHSLELSASGDTALVGAQDDETNGSSSGSAFVFERSGSTWHRQTKLTPDDGDEDDLFGTSVALAGETAVVGAPYDEDPNGEFGGAAYVFEGGSGSWDQRTKLAPDAGDADDVFGWSVAVDGDTALVSAWNDEDPNGSRSGSAYVYVSEGGSWTRQEKLAANDGDEDDLFGLSVDLSGDTAVVGAGSDEDPNGDDAGSAYVFQRTGSDWDQRTKLAATDGDSRDDYGHAIALADAGDRIVVGAYSDEDPHGFRSGSAYVYDLDGGRWDQNAKLTGQASSLAGESFGTSVALEDGTAVIGTVDDAPNGDRAGAVYVYERRDGSWRSQAKVAPEDGAPGDEFGADVSMAGDAMLVGAPFRDNDNGDGAGAAYVYRRSGGSWNREAKLTSDDGDDDDWFGSSVALTPERAVVGTPNDEDPNGARSGSAYLFERTGGSWSQTAKLAADDGDKEDGFGEDVALAGDTAIVGADRAEGTSGTSAGAAYVFETTGDSWTQRTKLLPEDGNDTDDFGASVTLDGNVAVVGSPFDKGPDGAFQGAAYVFERSGGAWTREGKLTPELDETTGPLLGESVALSGDVALIGAGEDQDPNGPGAGSVYRFERRSGSWRAVEKLAASDGDESDGFGASVGLDGETYLVGAPRDEDPNGPDSGSAYVFETDNSPPTAEAGADRTVEAGSTVELDATGSTDPDGDGLTYSWSQTGGTSVSLTDADTATPEFTVPDVSTSTDLDFEVTVSDGTDSDTDSVTITVEPSTGRGSLATRSLGGSTVPAGGELSVTLSAAFDSDHDAVSILDEYAGPLDSGSIDSIAVDGSELADSKVSFSDADAGGVTLAVEDVPAGTLEVTYSVSVADDAASGATVEFTGNTDEPDVSAGDVTAEFGTSTAAVAESAVDAADEDGDGDIDDGELRSAIVDWSGGVFSDGQLRDIIVEWSS